ncbi:MAG: hypothetical protein EBU90_24175 [Proteobacteria bacterium]|nr:hypothetical protein [Pseudomonadota bacterium]NBP15818.1 hypothetical protein [bacterium]
MPTVDECKNDAYKIANRSACDQVVSEWCKANPNELNFCGCSSNAFKQELPNPKMGRINPKCWAESCSTNVNAYRFGFNDGECNYCIDNSYINMIASTSTDSEFRQSSCGGTNITNKDDKKSQEQVAELKKYATYGAGTSAALIICICCTVLILSIMILRR